MAVERHQNRRWAWDDLNVPTPYWLVIALTVLVTALLLVDDQLDEYGTSGKVFVAVINVTSPIACVVLTIVTRRVGLRGYDFTRATTTIRSVAAAWVGFFGLAVLDGSTSLDLRPELTNLYVLAAITSLLALAGPAWTELAAARSHRPTSADSVRRMPLRRYGT